MKSLYDRLPETEKAILEKEAFSRNMVLEPLKKMYYVSEMELAVAYHLSTKLYDEIYIDMTKLFKLFK